MNSKEFNKVIEAKKAGWKFVHLMGSKMSASNGTTCFIVEATTSVSGYRDLLKKINNN